MAQIAVIVFAAGTQIKKIDIGKPGPNEVLIRNVAVAANPKDWKLPAWQKEYSFVEGNDVAGYIEEVGDGVTEFKKGDRVAAFSKMGTRDNKYGAYAEYTVAPANCTFPIGSNTSFEDASTLPLAVMTAAIGLFAALAISEPPATSEGGNVLVPSISSPAIIINGASSSVGAYAVQLAKRAGFFVVGIAGKSKDYAKSLGADIVLDYREEKDLEASLVKVLGVRKCAVAYDAVTADGSTLMLANVIAKTKGEGTVGKVTFVLNLTDEEKSKLPPDVEPHRTSVGTAYGDQAEFAAKYYRLISKWVDQGAFKPNQVRVMPGGLSGVEEGLKLLKEGQVHAEKLVYRIEETPGLKA